MTHGPLALDRESTGMALPSEVGTKDLRAPSSSLVMGSSHLDALFHQPIPVSLPVHHGTDGLDALWTNSARP